MFLITARSIFQLFLLILGGILGYRLKIIKESSLSSINGILLHIALPFLFLRAFQSDILFANKDILPRAVFFTLFMQCFALALSFIFIRKSSNANIERVSLTFTNNAYIAIPLLAAIFGEIGTLYASAANVANSLMFWSICPLMISGKFSVKDFVRKSFNDKVIISIFGIILLLLDVHIPSFLMTPIGYMADMTTPLSMISIGVTIASSDISRIMSKRVVWISFLRLVVFSAITCAIFAVLIHDRTELLCYCVLASTPAAATITVLTEQAGLPTEEASGIFLLTTMASAVTIPIIMLVVSSL